MSQGHNKNLNNSAASSSLDSSYANVRQQLSEIMDQSQGKKDVDNAKVIDLFVKVK